MTEQDQGGQGGQAVADQPRTYTREELRDSAFFAEHKADILKAYAEGRIK
jgi:hypothetical protein